MFLQDKDNKSDQSLELYPWCKDWKS